MSDEIIDDPFEEGETDQEIGEAKPYDEDSERQAGEDSVEAMAQSGSFDAVPGGTKGMERSDLDERAERARAGGNSANAVAQDEVGSFSSQRKTKSGNTTVPSGELDAVMARMARMEKQLAGEAPAQKARPAPGTDKPLRYYIIQSHGGAYYLRAFRNLETMQGYAQALPGEKRVFAYDHMPESDEINVELPEINALGEKIKR